MADTKISALGAVATTTTAIEFPVNQAGTTKKLTLAQVYGGIAGGKTVTGGTGAGDDLTLQSTSNGTKGSVFIGSKLALDEANGRLAIGHTAAAQQLHQIDTNPQHLLERSGSGADEKVWRHIVGATGYIIDTLDDARTTNGTERVSITRSGNAITDVQIGDSAASWMMDIDIANGHVAQGVPTSAPAVGDFQNGQIIFYISGGNLLAKYRTGGVMTGGAVATLS